MSLPGFMRGWTSGGRAEIAAETARAQARTAKRMTNLAFDGHVTGAKDTLVKASMGLSALSAGSATSTTQATTISHMRAAIAQLDEAGRVHGIDDGRKAAITQAREGLDQLSTKVELTQTSSSTSGGLFADTSAVISEIEGLRTTDRYISVETNLLNARTHAMDLNEGMGTAKSLEKLRGSLGKAYDKSGGYDLELTEAVRNALDATADLRPTAGAPMLKANVATFQTDLAAILSALG